jgi:hypothetical protein
VRTTGELSDDDRSVLHFLAAQRGLRGYSELIQEPIDFYIKEKTGKKSDITAFENERNLEQRRN